MPQLVQQVPGFGEIRELQGVEQSGRYRICRLIVNFGDEAGRELIESAIDRMTLVKVRDITGEPSSTKVLIQVDTKGQKSPASYARKTRSDVASAIIAAARNNNQTVSSTPSLRSDYKSARTPAQRGNLARH